MTCFQCKKLNQQNKLSCGHSMCHKCLGRLLILNEFRGLDNIPMSIEFKCKCLKGSLELPTAQYITILNTILTDHSKNLDGNSSEINMSDELSTKLYQSIKKKKKLLANNTFEAFTSFINTIETGLMFDFKKEIKETIDKFDVIISAVEASKKMFIEKMNLKMTQLNSMFVIIKMVYFHFYKDYNNLTDMTILNYLSQVSCELSKIKFYPNVNRLETIKEELKSFDTEDHLKCLFLFQSIPDSNSNWKPKKIIPLKSEGLITSLIQLKGEGQIAYCTLNDFNIKVIDIKSNPYSLIYTLSPHKNIIKKIIQVCHDSLVSCCSREIKVWSLRSKESTSQIELNTDFTSSPSTSEFISICDVPCQQIGISLNDGIVKIMSLKDNTITNSYHCEGIPYVLFFNTKSNYLICGSDNGDITCFDIKINQCDKKVSYSIGEYHITSMIEWKGKLLIASSDKDIKLYDIKSNKEMNALKGHTRGVTGMNLFLNKLLITSSFDFDIRLWDLIGMKCTLIVNYNKGWINIIVPLQNGQFATGGMDNSITVWNYE